MTWRQRMETQIKKIDTLLLALTMLFCMTACGSSTPKEPDHILAFKEGKIVTMNDTEYVGIFFDYTNNSGETALPCLCRVYT